MNIQHISGLMLVLATRDSVLYAGGLGYANQEEKVQVNDRHLFRMGSITKMFVALGILNLIQEGKLQLNDPIRLIAPEIGIQNNWEITDPVRVVNLLEHTAGFDDMHPNAMYNFNPTDLRGLEEVNLFNRSLHCRWRPGERWAYSNPDYAVLAYLIEKMAGQPWENYLENKVLRPIGMTQSNFNYRPDNSGKYVQGYMWIDGQNKKIPYMPIYGGAAGTFNACAIDMAKYLQFYLRHWEIADAQYLSKQALEEMETTHSTLAAAAGLKTGYGLANETYGINEKFMFRGHTGSIAGFESSFMYNRELGVGYALSKNSGYNLGSIEPLLKNYLTGSLTSERPKSGPANINAIKPFLGWYRFESPREELGSYFEMIMSDLELKLDGDALAVHSSSGVSKLVSAGPMMFCYEGDHSPRIVLTTDFENNLVMMDRGTYFRKISQFEAWYPIILLFGSIIVLLSTIPAGIIWLIMVWRSKQGNNTILFRLLPALGTLVLLLSLVISGDLSQHYNESIGPDFRTGIIFAGTIIFPACMVAALIGLVARKQMIQNRWLKIYLSVIALAGCYIMGLMFANDLIGLRVWAY
jgi:CubicO group peptidase (beta-lactamase class C family)